MSLKNSLPRVLWFIIIVMAIFACIHLVVSFSKPIQLLAFTINIILLIGLYYRQKWAYIITIIASLIAPIAIYNQNNELSVIILLLNSIILLPLLIATRYFFPKTAPKK